MRLFAHYAYRLTKADTTGSLFERVLRMLEGPPPVQFLLADHADGSGVPRVKKRFPALASFEHSALNVVGGPMVHLVHLDARFREHVPGGPPTGIDTASLAEIANGIPRSFPVHDAVFYFADVPWAGVTLPRFAEISHGYECVFLDGPPRLGDVTESAAVAADVAVLLISDNYFCRLTTTSFAG